MMAETFWTNPQYQVEVIDPDENDDENTGTLIVGLMQKDMRKKKAAGGKAPSIGIMIYQVRHCHTCTRKIVICFHRRNTIISMSRYIE
jgi:hypothetical protein